MATKGKSSLKTFNVTACIRVEVGVEFMAEDWDSALARAKELKVEDFITINGDYQDGENPHIKTLWVED
jgi:hypothetical protein